MIYINNRQKTVRTAIMMQFAAVVVNLKKNTGADPIKSPMVVHPNARPGVAGMTDTSIPRVIAIVMLKSMTPMSDIVM